MKKKPTSITDKLSESSTSRSSTVGTKKSPPASHDKSSLSVLRPKVYIIDSSSFKHLVQELTGKEAPSKTTSSPSSSLSSSSSPPLPSIVAVEDTGFMEVILTSSEDNSTGQVLPQMSSPDTNSLSSPCDMDYVPFPAPTNHMGFDFSYDDIESWLLEMEPVTSGSMSRDMEPIDVSIYDYDFS
ncbi:hypothetical protein MLD38_029341 [Melastoma candidum]|uniref:Uncharacterized protein n=1 Tax=Melastoma candidum TaxID=119954 RepID=A0ACB9N3F1_9MYRT|nr:hypothetical protein MLD38_029341 [Melastoma candidum]